MSTTNTNVMTLPNNSLKAIETYMLSKDMETIISEELENYLQEPEIITIQLLKKYRARNYDKSDEEYATQMRKYEIPQEFRDFTEGLMDETYINRFGLLQAIEDFQRTRPEIQLSCAFQDSAFNFRPYQPCVIS